MEVTPGTVMPAAITGFTFSIIINDSFEFKMMGRTYERATTAKAAMRNMVALLNNNGMGDA